MKIGGQLFYFLLSVFEIKQMFKLKKLVNWSKHNKKNAWLTCTLTSELVNERVWFSKSSKEDSSSIKFPENSCNNSTYSVTSVFVFEVELKIKW